MSTGTRGRQEPPAPAGGPGVPGIPAGPPPPGGGHTGTVEDDEGPRELRAAAERRCPVTLPAAGAGQPGRACRVLIPRHHLMDPPHWRLVDPDLQVRVIRTYARGTVPDRGAYLEARRAAIECVENKLMEAAMAPRPLRRG